MHADFSDDKGYHDGTKEMKEAGRDIADAADKVGNTIKEETKDLGRNMRDADDTL